MKRIQMTEEQKKEERNRKDRERYARNKESREKQQYRTDKASAKRFIKKARPEDLAELEKLLNEYKK